MMCDEEGKADRPSLPEQEGQKQCPDVGAIHVCIREDDDPVVPQAAQLVILTASSGGREEERGRSEWGMGCQFHCWKSHTETF